MLNLSIISCSVVPSSNGPHQFRTCPSCVSSAPEQEDHRCNKNMIFIPQPHRHCHVGSPLRSPPVPPLQCWCVTILRTTGEDPRKINGIHPQRAPFNIAVGGLGARPSQEQQAECDRKDARSNHFCSQRWSYWKVSGGVWPLTVLQGVRWFVVREGFFSSFGIRSTFLPKLFWP